MRVFNSLEGVQPGFFRRTDAYETVLEEMRQVIAACSGGSSPYDPDNDGYVVLPTPRTT